MKKSMWIEKVYDALIHVFERIWDDYPAIYFGIMAIFVAMLLLVQMVQVLLDP